MSAMDITKPALPISFPLMSLDELEDRSLLSSFHFPYIKCSVPFPGCIISSIEGRSKLLVCHDFKGGYQDDKFVQGDLNGKAYSLWHWHCIDIFVYFSHSLVTLPPPCWMNAAHLHGVQVLGTFITEWDQGAETCKRLLASKDSARMYASRLTELAYELGFDGWLINIENVVAEELIENLKEFVRHLTASMHELVEHSQVIWYDAVTTEGKLDWQDLLNSKNKAFFDVCDGIFTNYTWKEDYPLKSAEVAGNRAFDVYMGVDVFGRNTYGGGGYQSDVALKVALSSGVSAALFAPGWVYETNQGPNFEDAQNRFWTAIRNTWPVAARYTISLPFFSDFSQGFGKEFYLDGKVTSDRPWSNISCQNLQPLLNVLSDGSPKVSVRSDSSIYNGGSCLQFMGNLDESQVHIVELYRFNALLTKDAPIAVSFSVITSDDYELSIALKTEDGSGCADCVVLSPSHVNNDSLWSERECKVAAVDNSFLTQLLVVIHSKNVVVTDIIPEVKFNRNLVQSLKQENTKYEVLLGHIKIRNSIDLQQQEMGIEAAHIEWLKGEDGVRTLNAELVWKFEANENKFRRFYVFVQERGEEGNGDSDGDGDVGGMTYLGVAFVTRFYVDSLAITRTGKARLFFQLLAVSDDVENTELTLNIDIPFS